VDYPFDCISNFIFAETEIEKSDVILIPGTSQSLLMEKAADLYHKGLAKYILPSGGPNYKVPIYESEWEYLKTIGVRLGVPEAAILKENKAQNTFENAQFSWDVLKGTKTPVKNVILVCKAYHSRRALLTYKLFFPSDVNFFVSPVVDRRDISKDNWFSNEESIKIVMNEIVKIGKYFEDKIPMWLS
jgi:uncharacterized SAM-binding protein YcdF (DUF218 family)